MTGVPRRSAWIQRCGGVLLHITSLPSGRLGEDAERMAALLAEAGIKVWQLLPVGPTDRYRNPFQPSSAFAASTDLDPPQRAPEDAGFRRFAADNEDWLEDWALFVALKADQGGRCWWEWPASLRDRKRRALGAAARRLAEATQAEKLAQYAFSRSWSRFRHRANDQGLLLFGDVPLFVAHDSADVWAHRDLFEVTPDGRCEAVVGVPPDSFAKDGQLWGYPPYRWDAIAATGFAWWKRRFDVQAQRFDLVRLDHFRGFAAWWRVPGGARTAAEGEWIPGPGAPALEAIRSVLKGGELVAEDLGLITEDVIALREGLRIPGMRVLQFAFDGDPRNEHLPENHGPDTVCYTGTHDNDTTLGWWQSLSEEEREPVCRYLGEQQPEMPQALVDCAWRSPAPLTVIPLQDLLGLGSEARTNRPGVADGNWNWRFRWQDLPSDFGRRLRGDLERHDRLKTGRPR